MRRKSNMKKLYLDVHALETVPPSCVNRDDTGSPKSAIYGGKVRSRVSSQAWKKAIRENFKKIFREEDLGLRTKKIVEMVQKDISKLDASIDNEKAEKMAIKALENAGLKIKNVESGTDALMFMSRKQSEELARLIIVGEKDKKAFKKALKEHPSFDMALFGRMVASDAELNYDACCQVSHAISTHEVQTEYDYFTAVDDLDTNTAASSHIGMNEFNSSTLYRYATIDLTELYKSVGLEVPKVAEGFVKAFVQSMPTGKENSYANRVLPCLVYVTIRSDLPLNLVGAFENAVQSNAGYEEESIRRLEKQAKNMYGLLADQPVRSFVTCTHDINGILGENEPLSKLLSDVGVAVQQLLEDEVA